VAAALGFFAHLVAHERVLSRKPSFGSIELARRGSVRPALHTHPMR
jgi:hypothetical protein